MAIKKFKFHLEALLKVRKMEEERALQELSEIVAKVNQAKEKVKELEMQYQNELKKFHQMYGKEGFDIFYQSFERFLNRLENLKKQTEIYVQSLEPELEKAKQKVMEAKKNTRILEILKEKKWDEFKKELKKQEQKELFEINQNLTKKQYETLESISKLAPEEKDQDEFMESREDIRTRQERETREYYKKRGISS